MGRPEVIFRLRIYRVRSLQAVVTSLGLPYPEWITLETAWIGSADNESICGCEMPVLETHFSQPPWPGVSRLVTD